MFTSLHTSLGITIGLAWFNYIFLHLSLQIHLCLWLIFLWPSLFFFVFFSCLDFLGFLNLIWINWTRLQAMTRTNQPCQRISPTFFVLPVVTGIIYFKATMVMFLFQKSNTDNPPSSKWYIWTNYYVMVCCNSRIKSHSRHWLAIMK